MEGGPGKPGPGASQHGCDCRDQRSAAVIHNPAWVIIGRLVSLSSRRLAATLAALFGGVLVGAGVIAGPLPDSTWEPLPALPQQGQQPIFALAVDPANNQVLIAGNSPGSLQRSTDGGSTWVSVRSGRAAVTTIAFSPFTPGLAIPSPRWAGALISTDAGSKLAQVTGLYCRAV